MRFEVPALLHSFLERGELFVVNEYGHVACVGEIDQRHKIGRTRDPIVVAGGSKRKRRREERSAQAIANGVDAAFPCRRLDRVKRGEGSLKHVVFEALSGEAFVWIDP